MVYMKDGNSLNICQSFRRAENSRNRGKNIMRLSIKSIRIISSSRVFKLKMTW